MEKKKKERNFTCPRAGNHANIFARTVEQARRSNLDKMLAGPFYKLEATCGNVVNSLGDTSWNCVSKTITPDGATMPLKRIAGLMKGKEY